MKATKVFLGRLLGLLILAASFSVPAATNDLSATLQRGLFEEEANHDFNAAIRAYQSVVTQFDKDRKLAATAVFRLGECYRKQGKMEEAKLQYERILREFADQTKLVELSRNYVSQPIASSTNSNLVSETSKRLQQLAHPGPTVAATSEEEQEIRRIKALIKDSPDLFHALNTSFTDSMGIDRRGTLLHAAAALGHLTVVEFLLNSGMDINARTVANTNGYTTPLALAAEGGHRAMVELLIDKGANPEATNLDGNTALHLATEKGYRSVVESLAAKGASLQAQNKAGKTPLFFAMKNQPMMEYLLAKGADVNAKTKAGWTPLFEAVHSGSTEAVRTLLQHGADVNVFLTLPDLAPLDQPNAKTEIADLYPERGPDGEWKLPRAYQSAKANKASTPLYVAVMNKNKEIAELLLKHGANPNSINEIKFTPRHQRIFPNDKAMRELLMAHQHSAVSGLNVASNSPLHWAVGHSQPELAELLLQYGANVNSQNSEGVTPLYISVETRSKPLVELLLKHKADPNLANREGIVPLALVNAAATQLMGSLIASPGNSKSTKLLEEWKDIANLLAKYGADENQHRRQAISVTRNYTQQFTVFMNGATNFENRVFLFDALAQFFGAWKNELPFPDLASVKISRLEKSGKTNSIHINVEEAFAIGDCSKNMALQWGDVIFIPEKDHKLNEAWPGLGTNETRTLSKCLSGLVEIKVKGQTKKIALVPGVVKFHHQLAGIASRGGLNDSSAFAGVSKEQVMRLNSAERVIGSFWLDDVIKEADVLLSTSDITQIKVKREDGSTIMLDSTKQKSPYDLYLRDGDVIEVPEKP